MLVMLLFLLSLPILLFSLFENMGFGKTMSAPLLFSKIAAQRSHVVLSSRHSKDAPSILIKFQVPPWYTCVLSFLKYQKVGQVSIHGPTSDFRFSNPRFCCISTISKINLEIFDVWAPALSKTFKATSFVHLSTLNHLTLKHQIIIVRRSYDLCFWSPK
jgi:hypothetical protein